MENIGRFCRKYLFDLKTRSQIKCNSGIGKFYKMYYNLYLEQFVYLAVEVGRQMVVPLVPLHSAFPPLNP